MKSNQVLLIGYVGQHLKSVRSVNGVKRVGIRLATHILTDGQGKKVNKTVWHDVVAWGELAAYAERSFVKGSHILVDGSIEYRTYADHSGHIRYQTRIKGDSMINLDR